MADDRLVLKGAAAKVVREVLAELAQMDASGLPRDASMATAAGSLSVRTVNRATWLYRRLPGQDSEVAEDGG